MLKNCGKTVIFDLVVTSRGGQLLLNCGEMHILGRALTSWGGLWSVFLHVCFLCVCVCVCGTSQEKKNLYLHFFDNIWQFQYLFFEAALESDCAHVLLLICLLERFLHSTIFF